ncbi:hypothetical protein [Pseudomonas aeruginosa]|uniref:hypothetical protein n=1 Tax=Pseudomonas aeruginosa TaxID=287 RepID=UPI001C3FC5F8|nr:hypothetical protein [Pseudomonas aeruginosa]
MTESKICTCPSGDGSLRWPCPAHPAEQAGGDERAAFKTAYLAEFDCDADGDDNMAHSNTAWRAWKMARAALAHRAPEVCSECSDTGKVYDESGDGPWSCYACTGNPEVIGYANGDELDNMLDDRTAVLSPGKTSFHTVPVYRLIRAALAQPSPAQAEAERPEVVARVVHSNPVVLGQCGPLNANDELMTVAQHAASVARWAEMFNRVEQERDAALARVAELEGQSGFEFVYDSDELVAVPRGLLGAACHAIDKKRYAPRIIAKLREYARGLPAPVAQAQQLNDLDKQCRDDVARALGLRPNQERGFAWSYLLASIKSCVKASGDSAQAKHSVPEEFSFEYRHPNGESHTVTVSRDQVINEMPDFLFEALCSKFCNCEPAGETNVVECCCDEYAEEFRLLAAAPVCRLSRSALTDAQMRRLYDSSTETENERLGFAAFARLIRRAEAVHQISAAPGKEGCDE